MEYIIENMSGLGRTSKLKTKKLELRTPISWFALSNIESKSFQTKVFTKGSIESFLCNVYDLKFKDKKDHRRELVQTLKEMGLNSKCDSGGYQAMSKGVVLTQEEVAGYQIELDCNLSIQLDHPLTLDIPSKEVMKRIDYNTKNLQTLVDKYRKTIQFVPTIHGHDSKTLDYSINSIKEILGNHPKIVAIGSLVPLSLNSNIEKKKKIVDILLYVRKKMPKTLLHILGMGGSMTYVGVYCGADSFDSAGWAQKSGFGVIQLPGVSDRYIEKTPNGRRALDSDESIQFLDCNCPACKFYINNLLDYQGKGENKRLLRAIHNLHLFQTEIEKIKRSISNDFLDEFVRARLKNSKWLSLIDYAKSKIAGSRKVTIDEFF
ncbi:MAG: tRNA-guanine transglycosylase [Candidatus Heimdallarchaeota archaeon]